MKVKILSMNCSAKEAVARALAGNMAPHDDRNQGRDHTPTHTAYTPKLDGGKFVHWLEIGSAWKNQQGCFDIQLDQMPPDRDDFTGYVRLAPIGATPPPPDPDDQMTEEP